MLSVVVRTKNEATTLRKTMEGIVAQTYRDIEIILVDNESKDATTKIAKAYGVKVLNIADQEFSHANSCNLGVKYCKGELVYFTNGHSRLISSNAFSSVIGRFEKYESLAGMYGRADLVEKDSKANYLEKLSKKINDNKYPGQFAVYTKLSIGMLQTQSCCIRKDLLLKYPFENMTTGGGEDALLAKRLLKSGFTVAYDPTLNVYHYHGGSSLKFLKRSLGYLLMGLEVRLRN